MKFVLLPMLGGSYVTHVASFSGGESWYIKAMAHTCLPSIHLHADGGVSIIMAQALAIG